MWFGLLNSKDFGWTCPEGKGIYTKYWRGEIQIEVLDDTKQKLYMGHENLKGISLN